MNILDGTNLNKEFCESIKNGTVIVSCGCRASGKSTFMLSTLRACVEANTFEDYILVFPSLHVEQHDSYCWCVKQKKFTIYTGYHNSILEKLYIQNRDLKKQKKTLVVIDDATAFAKELRLATNEYLVGLMSQARHLQVTLYLLVHSLKNILSPVLRENVTWLLIYSVTNSKLLSDIWEEWISIQCDYKTFIEWYRNISKEKYSSFLLKCTPPVMIDLHSNDWQQTKYYREKNMNEAKAHKDKRGLFVINGDK